MKHSKVLVDEIRRSVENESLSFIVGSGFSRNISLKFPLWDDLIRPLVKEMYPDVCVGNVKKREAKVKQILAEKTYLGVASEYVRRKGYHEVIDLYIEKNIPYLERRRDNGFDLVLNGKVIDSDPSLECHHKLLSMDAKHIFTFNYDNTLDILADVESAKDLLDNQIQAENKKQKYKSLLEEYKREYEKLNNDLNHIISSKPMEDDSKSQSIIFDFSSINAIIGRADIGLSEYYDEASDFRTLYHTHVAAFEREIMHNQAIADSAKEKRMSQYQLLTNAYQISLTDGCKNIYKLHGNLRTKTDMSYGFDGDRRMQYVITQEDYDAYSQKHEAFVNLMRISLLKGNFCLIGFSGDDPNFIAWIDWVKDILDDSDCHETQASRSVYYINADNKVLDASKSLLLQNHYINVVNLHELFPEANSYNERMLRFLDYISKDKLKYEKYNESWRKINLDRKSIGPINGLLHDIEQVYKLSDFNRIPNQFGIAHYNRSNLFARVDSILKTDIPQEFQAKLIYSAIRGELMPLQAVLTSNFVRQLSNVSAEMKIRYRMLEIRNRVLNGELVDEQESEWGTYETCVGRLFNLKFEEADKVLCSWHPTSGINLMRKYMLQSVYDREKDTDAITSLINPDNFESIQDYKYALDLLPQIRGIFMDSKDGGVSVCEDLRHQKETMEKRYPSLKKYNEQIDGLLEEINKNKSQPFGNVREVFSLSSYDSGLVNSTKVLQILIELAMPTKSSYTILLDAEKWLKIFENLYKKYPIPCLYFSLLYGNERDKLRRIAQMYIYSEQLRGVLPKMLEMMLSALMDKYCPLQIREGIFIVAPYLMKAVPPDKWLSLFEAFYDEFDLKGMEDARRIISGASEFIICGVRLSANDCFKHKVLYQTLCLGNEIKGIHNSLIIAASKNLTVDEIEQNELKHLLDNATTATHMYVLMNMSKWIGRTKVAEKLCSLDVALYTDCVLLEAACRYAQDLPELHSKLKGIILGSHSLWLTGISDDYSRVSHGGEPFDVCDAQRYVRFNNVEVKSIYIKLRESFKKIDTITRKWHERKMWNFLNDWTYLLTIMQSFLRNNKSMLKAESDYTSLTRAVTKLLNQGRGGYCISSLLLDDEKTAKALSWLALEVYQNGAQRLQYEYSLLVNKLLSRNSSQLNNCFKHFGWALTSYSDGFNQEQFMPLLKSVLEVYKSYFVGGTEVDWNIDYAEKNVVEQELCKIYKVYKLWGGHMKFWDDYVPRYFN